MLLEPRQDAGVDVHGHRYAAVAEPFDNYLRFTPADYINVAWACLRPWKVRCGSFASWTIAAKSLLTFSGSTGDPSAAGKDVSSVPPSVAEHQHLFYLSATNAVQ